MNFANQKYTDFLKRFSIDASFVTIQDPDAPVQTMEAQDAKFTVSINLTKTDPDLSYESYVAYNARVILLPRLVLETDRLILRRCCMEDAPGLFPLLSDEMGMFLDGCKAFSQMDEGYYDRIALFAKREQYVISLKESGQIIGTLNLFQDDSRAVDALEIGYGIDPDHRRMGYAFEAVQGILDLLLNDLQVPLITAGALLENIPSARLLEKLGFQKEGIRRKALWHEALGKPADLQYYYIEK